MSLVPALDELDHKLDHGWSQANRFSNTVTVSQPGSDIEHWQHSSDSIEENYQRQPSSIQRNWFDRELSKSDRNWHHSDNEEAGEDWQEEPVHHYRDNEETGEDWHEVTAHLHRHQEETGGDWQEEQVHSYQEWQHTDRQENRNNWEEGEESSPDPEDWQQDFSRKNWQQKPEQIRNWKQAPRSNIPDNWQEDEESQESREDWPQGGRQEPPGNWKQAPRRNIPDNWQEDEESQESKKDWQQIEENKSRQWHHNLPKSQENWQQRNIPKNWPHKDSFKQVPHRENWHQKSSIHKNWPQEDSIEFRSNWQQKERSGGNNWEKHNFLDPEEDWQRDSSEDWDEEELPEEAEDWLDRETQNQEEVWHGKRPDQRHHFQSHQKSKEEISQWEQVSNLPQSRPSFHPALRKEVDKNWQRESTRREEEEREEEDHWQQDNRISQSRPGCHPTSREGNTHYQGKNIRREEHWQPKDNLPESRPSFHSALRKEVDKNWQRKDIRREEEGEEEEEEHWQQDNKLPAFRPGFPPAVKKEADKNWHIKNIRKEEEEGEEEHWQQANRLPESRAGWHPTSRKEADKQNQGKNIRREGDHWQQDNTLPQSRPGFPPASRRETDKNWHNKNTRREEEEEEEEHWKQGNKLPESRPGFPPGSRREADKNWHIENTRREKEEEGEHWEQGNKLPESRPGFPPASQRQADKNLQGKNIRREGEREHWQQEGQLPEIRPGFNPASRREIEKNLQGKNTRTEQGEHWKQQKESPVSKPGCHPTPRRETDKNWQKEGKLEPAEHWQLQQQKRIVNWKQPQSRLGNWQQGDSSEEELLEDWHHNNRKKPLGNWFREESLDSTENWELVERQKASQHWHQEGSSESEDNWPDREAPERTENWQESKKPLPPKNWQFKESQQKRENLCGIPPQIKKTTFPKQPEKPDNWKDPKSTESAKVWQERRTNPSKPGWPQSRPSKQIEDWPDSESEGPPEDWEEESEESLPPSDLSEPDDWPDIDLPEPVQENNKQPIIQEIREEDIVSVPNNIIKSVPGTPKARLVSTPKGQSVLVHSEGNQYVVVSSSNKQSPQQTSLSQLVTFRPRHNLQNILTKKDNPKNFQLRAPNQHPRFAVRCPNIRGNSPRSRIASNSPGIRLIHSAEGGFTVFPAGSPSTSGPASYNIPAAFRGRGRGRGRLIPPNRGGSNRSRGQNIRGRGNSSMIRPPRGASNVQYNPNIQGGRFPTQVRLVNPSPHNPQPQILRPRGSHTPQIIRYKVTRNPTIGSRNSVPIVTSVSASSSSSISVNNVTSTSEHNLPIQQQEITSLSSEKDSLVSEDNQSVESSQSSQMIVDHEYAAPEPNTKSSESAASNRQGTDLSDSDSSQSCHNNIETTYPPSDGNGQTSPETSPDSNRTSVSLPGTPVPSKKNTLPLGTGKLEVNTVYLIKSPSFPERKMIWNGEKFQEYDERTHTITSENSEENMSGGGVGENNRGKQIRGNATGLHMTQNRSMIVRPANPSQSTTKVLHKTATNQINTNDILPNGRTWKHATKPCAILTRRPLHPESDRKVIIVDTSSAGKSKRITVVNDSSLSASASSSQESVQTQSQEDQGESNQDHEMQQQQHIVESKKRKRLQESGYQEGECVVHCKYCGYSSSNVIFCDRCHREFPDDVKIEPLVKKGRTCVSVKENETNVAIDKRTFYGQKLAEQSQPYQANIVHVTSEGEIIQRKVTSAPPTAGRYRMVRISSARRKPAMPVTVTISSDEEDETSTRPSSAGSSAAAEEADSLSQIIAEIPKGRPSSPKFNVSRVQKMEDEMGNPVLVRKAGRKNIHVIPVNRSVLDNPNCVKVKSIQQPPLQVSVNLTARCIRIGSLRGVPVEPIFISADGVFLYIECEDNSHRIIIEPQNVVQCLVCTKVTPVIFIRTTPEFSQDLRSSLKMDNDTDGPYFDPQHPEMKNQYIMLLLQEFGNVHHSLLNILSQYSNSNEEHKKDFLCELSPEEADQIFKSINFDTSVFPNFATDSVQNNPAIENQMEVARSSDASMMAGMSQESKMENRERSPSPKIMFSGPVKKLITFPPPPAKGGITVTNEDLFCLTEGEFLNDVIIDFYLKYLLLERLNEEDRKRTHIFSSFFFKRLTQRLANRPEDGATPAEKRHSRVKTWTKHVDLFEKDFIVVPINEHSHWFLAIICFPGLLQNKTVTFIPKNRLESNLPCSSEMNVPKQGSPAPSSQNDLPKTDSTMPEEKSPMEQSEKQEQDQVKEQQQQSQLLEQDQDQQEQQQQQQEQQQEPQQEGQQPQQQEEHHQQEEQQQPQQQQQQQQQDEEMKDSNDNQTDENNVKETGELEPGEVPMDTSNMGVTKILPARYFSKESRGKLVSEEDLEDPKIAGMTVTGYRQPCIMVFDSLSGVSRSRIVNILKEYLQVEWMKKKQTELNLKERLRGGSPKVPQQTNYSDCGVYVLQYVESFFEDPIQDFSFPMKSLQTWFSGERIRRKREEIKELILTISEIQHKS